MHYTYTVEMQGGEVRFCDERELSRLSLKAASGEPSWQCESCNAAGWSQARACICVHCGADSPVDAALMTQLKQKKRAEMAQGRWRLRGLRLTLPPRELQQDARAADAYHVGAAGSEGDEVRAHFCMHETPAACRCCAAAEQLLCSAR